MPRPKKASPTYFEKLEEEVKSSNSPFSLILGALIVLVVGILVFNFFSQRGQEEVGPAQQTEQVGDVSPDKLPGKYTVKEGDTLFLIAQKYYQDGWKFTEIVKANNLANADALEVGQVLEIPKLAEEVAEATPTPTPTPSETPAAEAPEEPQDLAKGGGDTTIWGPKITADTYTVVEGDWLSTISARAYGDIFAYPKIAEANKIPNPDLIFPGQVLKLPR